MRLPTALRSLLAEQVVRANDVTDIQVSASSITISIIPHLDGDGFRTHSAHRAHLIHADSQHIIIQGLGIQGRALRYDVAIPYCAYSDGAAQQVTFPWPIAGIANDWRVTDEVLAKAFYLKARGLTPEMIAELLSDLYGVETDAATLREWLSEPIQRVPQVQRQSIPV